MINHQNSTTIINENVELNAIRLIKQLSNHEYTSIQTNNPQVSTLKKL